MTDEYRRIQLEALWGIHDGQVTVVSSDIDAVLDAYKEAIEALRAIVALNGKTIPTTTIIQANHQGAAVLARAREMGVIK